MERAAEDRQRQGRSAFYFSVDNVQQAYDQVVASGLKPAGEPIELRGNREFTIVDPDGYRLVFFKRK